MGGGWWTTGHGQHAEMERRWSSHHRKPSEHHLPIRFRYFPPRAISTQLPARDVLAHAQSGNISASYVLHDSTT